MKYSEILALDTHGLKSKIQEISKQLGELQLKKSISPSTTKNSSLFKSYRKMIAQMKFRLSTKD